ncbi:SITS-binding protein [Latimeria chalumnae]|uniref:Si:ch211-236l14.4 n=1 Tax=Latimeria chalumnae TaxID=7897 RepID=H3BHI9_LATCH|nr:PREDICTED: SITS-binding protein-like [Latimeria chalumnae]|eukprot:XP_005988077.1 PREDICTED: SITS-binding protein-like [Latimeria chalumnae]
MPHRRNPSPIPEVTWDSGLKEMNETWKGAIACLGVAIFFVMTIGIIYWQVVDQPNKNWILKGSFSGLIWERRTHSLIIQTLTEDKTFVEIDVGNFPDLEVPFVKNLCWLNKTDFCYTWDATAAFKISFDSSLSNNAECYSITWTPLYCHVTLKDCFSMVNTSWYGGASVTAQHWPLNNVNIESQPFIISDLKNNPTGYGSVLERYFLGSTGVAVIIAPDVPVHISIDSNKHFCLQTSSNTQLTPLQYTVCVSENIKTVHQEVRNQFSEHPSVLPSTEILWLPFWKFLGTADSAAKLERLLRSFFNKLKRHTLGEGVIDLNEHSTMLLSSTDHMSYARRKKRTSRQTMDFSLIKHLKISVTLSPYTSVDVQQFHSSLKERRENYWLGLSSVSKGYTAPLLTKWKGKFSVKLDVTNNAAVNWYIDKVATLQRQLGFEYVTFEGGEGNIFMEQALHPPKVLEGDNYAELFAAVVSRFGNTTIITAGTRSNHLPLFIRMTPCASDWSYAGLKGIIPSVLHYSLLGYNFFIPDAIGGSLMQELVTDEELFVRWLQIVTFLPVISFSTPPWVCDDWVLNLTRLYIQKHQDFVVPLIIKYAEEWASLGNPIFRPLWWINPNDPVSFTIDDEFLIGNEILVAPITEKGKLQRDIFLPGNDYKWMDTNTARVFDGGTLLKDYPVSLNEVAVFQKKAAEH